MLEKNHEYIRILFYKARTQEDITLNDKPYGYVAFGAREKCERKKDKG